MIKLIAISAISFTLAASLYGFFQSSHQEPYYSKLALRLMDQHINEMATKGFKVKITGEGMMNDVDCISIGFTSNETPTVDEARLLYVSGVEKLLARINSNETIRPYLHDFPFSANNLKYSLNFQRHTVDQSGVAPIVFVFNGRGKIFYSVNDPAYADTNPLRNAWEEPYSEALEIVRDAGQSPNDLDVP